MNQKGFISIIFIIGVIVATSAIFGAVKYKDEITANISRIFKPEIEIPNIEPAGEDGVIEKSELIEEPIIERKSKEEEKKDGIQKLQEQLRIAEQKRLETEKRLAEEKAKQAIEKTKAEEGARIKAEQELQRQLGVQRQLEARRLAEEQRQREIVRQQELERQLEIQRLAKERQVKREFVEYSLDTINKIERANFDTINFIENVFIPLQERMKKRMGHLSITFGIIANNLPSNSFHWRYFKANQKLFVEFEKQYEKNIIWWKNWVSDLKETSKNIFTIGKDSLVAIRDNPNRASIEETRAITKKMLDFQKRIFLFTAKYMEEGFKMNQDIINIVEERKIEIDMMLTLLPDSDYLREIRNWLFQQELINELRKIRGELRHLTDILKY